MTTKQMDLMRELFAAGASCADISLEMGVTANTVKRMKRMLGLHSAYDAWNPREEDELWRLHSEGVSNERISAMLGRPVAGVESRLARLRKRRQQTNPRKQYHVVVPDGMPPLTDLPKWPGCQCGYCPEMRGSRLTGEGIVGWCAKVKHQVQRADFCEADDEPLQVPKWLQLVEGELRRFRSYK